MAAQEYVVQFEDVECVVFAQDIAGAQEAAIEDIERLQRFTTAIVSIRRVQTH